MQRVAPHLRADYERFAKLLPHEETFERPFISYDTVLRAHYLICDYFESTTGVPSLYGVKDLNMMASAVGRQKTAFGSVVKWTTPLEVAATLFFGLVKNHAFHDGNKRTALLCAIYQLYLSGRFVDERKEKFEELTVKVAASEYDFYTPFRGFKGRPDAEVRFIADFFRRKTRRIDREFYALTFQEFDSKLRDFGCKLDEPSGNYINVFKRKVPTGFRALLPGITPRWVRIHQIGFPGWKRQVNLKAVKESLKACELTAAQGIDSEVFFRGAEPLYQLIQEFEGPLRRLRDK